MAKTCAASQATTDCKFLYQTEAQQRWIFYGYGCYLLCSTPHFVPLIAALLILCNAFKKMFLLGILQASFFNWKGVRCVALDPRIMRSLLEKFGDITFLIPSKAYLRARLQLPHPGIIV